MKALVVIHTMVFSFCAIAIPHRVAAADNLTPLAPPPDWSRLDPFQETISQSTFTRLLTEVFAPGDAWQSIIDIQSGHAIIAKKLPTDQNTPYILRFAEEQTSRPGTRFWRSRRELAQTDPSLPLKGLRVAIDPGHLGGRWAKTEERWFQIGRDKPVIEGDMTLRVALLLVPRLQALGASVWVLRKNHEPLTSLRPSDLRETARDALLARGEKILREFYTGHNDPDRANTIQFESEKLFYRVSEIRERAARVNSVIKPDLVLCLHFNAEPWGDPQNPALVERTHLHMLVNGCYSRSELAKDDVRLEMMLKLLSLGHEEEKAVSQVVGQSLAEATGLPPYVYPGTNAKRLTTWVWARNLLANRLYQCPVVYCEPYVMNSRQDYARIQAGDYAGVRNFGGVPRLSIYREYAEAVARGLARYYASRTE